MAPGWIARKDLRGPAIFGIALVLLWWLAGDVFKFSRDEGIILDGARRIAQGQQPYRDFFVLTGPLTFWIAGALAKLGGSLRIIRLPMILDAAFLVWAVYWIASRFAGRNFSAAISLAFLAYQARVPKLWVNHRWDSAALATAAVLTALAAHRKDSRALWAVSGFLAAAAAWATPTLLLTAFPLAVWAWRGNRRNVLAFFGGGALITAATAIYLQSGQALGPMIRSMLWTHANYGAANRMTYGQLVFLGVTGENAYAIPFTQNLLGSFYLLLPAVFPIAAVAGWGLYLWRGRNRPDTTPDTKEILALLGAVAALVFSEWPRWTADELFYTAALSTALCAALLYRVVPARVRTGVCAFLLFAAAVSIAKKVDVALDLFPFQSRVGTMRGTGEDQEFLQALERHIQPGDSLFAFPYLAPMYYLLNARNPTRYSFMQPGMMTAQDESLALAQLSAAPPRWVIFENLPAEVVLILWPGSDRAAIPMTAINTYLRRNYRDVETVNGAWGRFVIRERAER
jgi:hypothetical protein